MYNLTGIIDNSTTMPGFVQGVNSVLTFDLLGVLILITITIIALIAFLQSTGDPNKSIAAASFISFGMAIFLKMLGLIPNLALFITLVLSAAGIAFIWRE